MSDPTPLPSALPPDDGSDPERTDLLFPSTFAPDRSFTAMNDGTAEAPALGSFPPLVGRYRVSRELARGGMGAILAALDPDLGRDVAIKVLLEAHLGKPGYRERFVEEARITSALQHPNIIPVYELGELSDTRPFFAMSLVDGHTLDARLLARKKPTDDLARFLQVFDRICQALAYAHTRGVIHCDLKPSNVMVAAFGVVQVMDWGLARSGIRRQEPGSRKVEDRLAATRRGAIAPPGAGGTPSYLSPEQANAGRLDERTDVFGLGAILCAILTGQPLYLGKNTRRVLAQAARADLADTFARLDASPAARELVALAKRCLAPHPDQRPRNAREVATALTAYVESDLRQAERDLVRYFDLTPDLMCIAGLDGQFRRVNANFTRVLGYTSAELVSRPFIDFVHADDRAKTVVETEKLARGLPVVHFRNRYRDVRGAYRWFEWTAQSIPEENVIFAVARDITDRVELETRLCAQTDPGAAL